MKSPGGFGRQPNMFYIHNENAFAGIAAEAFLF